MTVDRARQLQMIKNSCRTLSMVGRTRDDHVLGQRIHELNNQRAIAATFTDQPKLQETLDIIDEYIRKVTVKHDAAIQPLTQPNPASE